MSTQALGSNVNIGFFLHCHLLQAMRGITQDTPVTLFLLSAHKECSALKQVSNQ